MGTICNSQNHEGGSNEYPKSMFYIKRQKNNVKPLQTPANCNEKVGLRGSTLHEHILSVIILMYRKIPKFSDARKFCYN